jgi:hypothetical protein
VQLSKDGDDVGRRVLTVAVRQAKAGKVWDSQEKKILHLKLTSFTPMCPAMNSFW